MHDISPLRIPSASIIPTSTSCHFIDISPSSCPIIDIPAQLRPPSSHTSSASTIIISHQLASRQVPPTIALKLHGLSFTFHMILSNFNQKTKQQTITKNTHLVSILHPPRPSSISTSTAAHDTVGAWTHSRDTTCRFRSVLPRHQHFQELSPHKRCGRTERLRTWPTACVLISLFGSWRLEKAQDN